MKKILLGVLMLFTILTLSSYASAQVYTYQVGDHCYENVGATPVLLLDYPVNLRGNLYCSISGSGYVDQDSATDYISVWLRVNGDTTTEDWSWRDVYLNSASEFRTSFHTTLGLYLTRGVNYFQLFAQGSNNTAEICNYSITIICNNRGEAWYDYL